MDLYGCVNGSRFCLASCWTCGVSWLMWGLWSHSGITRFGISHLPKNPKKKLSFTTSCDWHAEVFATSQLNWVENYGSFKFGSDLFCKLRNWIGSNSFKWQLFWNTPDPLIPYRAEELWKCCSPSLRRQEISAGCWMRIFHFGDNLFVGISKSNENKATTISTIWRYDGNMMIWIICMTS